MKYHSTRALPFEKYSLLSFSQALEQGLATDGGLFVPETFPQYDINETWGKLRLPDLAKKILTPFLAGDVLEKKLDSICDQAFNFEIPVKKINSRLSVLELFHGPTLAFKDVGAQFLAACLTELASTVSSKVNRTVLVATSGDTGGAVAAAFFKRDGFRVAILFPNGKVSPLQEKQLTCWGENIRAFAVEGDFDDCQKIVKTAFNNPKFQKFHLISANSINLGRLLPQSIYYGFASLKKQQDVVRPVNFIIPSGNLGNAVAGLWAKKMGFPIGKIILATNANMAVANYFASGLWSPKATVHTLANAMDVGNPSNMERLLHLYPDFNQLKLSIDAIAVSDAEIASTIQATNKKLGEILCPHTATAMAVFNKLTSDHWTIVATAHPAKFETVIEPLIGKKIEIPEQLKKILAQVSKKEFLKPGDASDLSAPLFEKLNSLDFKVV